MVFAVAEQRGLPRDAFFWKYDIFALSCPVEGQTLLPPIE